MHTYAETNLQTADWRLTHTPRVRMTEQERIEQYLVEMAMFSWTATYKAQEARLAELKEAH